MAWLLGRKLPVKDANNEEGLTPLHCCVVAGRLCSSSVEHLIRAGADCDARSECFQQVSTTITSHFEVVQ